MSSLNIAVYAEGCMYPPGAPNPVSTTITQLQGSGFTTAILGLFHISSTGDISFNNELVISQGQYVGDSAWPGLVNGMVGGTVKTVCASIGGGGVSDYASIQSIYTTNEYSFINTNLMSNFQLFKATFPSISIIDMDCEDTYDAPSFVAFCQMLIGMGFGITFCPYTQGYPPFWNNSMVALNTSNPGAVKWWNLQCYDGGGGNEPYTWAAGIATAIPGFDTNGFILAGDWTDDDPAAVKTLMNSFQTEACVGGGFIWTLDHIIANYASDPATGMQAYASAISGGLG